MSQTFSLRHKEIVEEQPSIKQMLERWPALFRKQCFAEFTRVANRDLEQDFFEYLDCRTPRFLEIFKSKKGIIGNTLSEILVQDSDAIADFSCYDSLLPPAETLRVSGV